MTDDASSAERAAVHDFIIAERDNLLSLPPALLGWSVTRAKIRLLEALADAIERGDHLAPDPQEHLARRG